MPRRGRSYVRRQTNKRHFRAVLGDVVALNGAHSRHRPHRRAPKIASAVRVCVRDERSVSARLVLARALCRSRSFSNSRVPRKYPNALCHRSSSRRLRGVLQRQPMLRPSRKCCALASLAAAPHCTAPDSIRSIKRTRVRAPHRIGMVARLMVWRARVGMAVERQVRDAPLPRVDRPAWRVP